MRSPAEPTLARSPPATRIAEIQGLRGLAVLGVLLFHIGWRGVAGGFAGVDVFFVISGFVIALLLRRSIETERFSFIDFYRRRAWRLLPALMAVLVLTAAAFALLAPTSVDGKRLPSLLAATVGLSNFYFARSVDYFDSGMSNPALHTWSLGVEEQFYLVFPCLLVLLARRRIAVRPVLWAVLLIGFAAAVVATSLDASKAFYLPWFRAWEFIAGALLAWYDRRALAARYGGWMSAGGLGLVLAAFVFHHDGLVFPGVGALAPVVGTVLLIAGAGHANPVNRLLASSPLRLLGDGSYSLYLAHWPVVCFAGMLFPQSTFKFQLMTLIVCLAAGFLLWRYIEQPGLRRYRPASDGRGLLGIPAGMAVVAGLLWLATSAGDALWHRTPRAEHYLQAATTDNALFRTGVCFLTAKMPFEYFDRGQCLTRTPGRPALLVLGDSLAANLVSALKQRMPDHDVLQATAVEYRPGNAVRWPDYTAQLDRVVQAELFDGKTPGIQSVMLFARWDADDLQPLAQLVDRLTARGVRVTVLGPSPEFYTGVPLILAYGEITGHDLVAAMSKASRRQLDVQFARVLGGKASYLSMMDAACPAMVCQVVGDGQSLYSDKVHFTRQGAARFVAALPF